MKSNKVNHSLDNLAKSVDANNGVGLFEERQPPHYRLQALVFFGS